MWSAFSGTILRNRIAVLVVIGLITVFMGWRATKVQLSYEFARILPDNDPDYIDYLDFKSRFGEDGSVLVIGLQSDKFFQAPVFNDFAKLGSEIKKLDGIEEVVSLGRIYHLVKNDSLQKLDFKPVLLKSELSQLELDSMKEIILGLPFYQGLLYNSESKATLMAVTLDKNKLNTRNRIALVDSIHLLADAFGSKHGIKLHYSGLPYIRTAITRKVSREIVLFIFLALAVTALILLVFFRSVRTVIFPLLIVIIGVVWAFGSIELLNYKISILTGLIPPLIIIIGVPNCILLLNQYQQEFKRHGNKIKALTRMVERIAVTTFLANVTTSIGFGVFYFTKSSILMEFGLVAAMNVMATWLISLVMIPVIFSFLKEPDIRHMKHLDSKVLTALLVKIDYLVHHRRWWIYGVVTLVIAISAYGAFHINTVGYIVDDLPHDDPIYVDLKFFETNFHGVMPFEISIDTKKANGVFADNARTLYKIKSLQRILGEYPEFTKPLSVVEFLKFAYQGFRDGESKFFILPAPTELKKLADFISNSPEQRGSRFKGFIDSTKQYTRVSVQVADVGSVRMRELQNELRVRIDSLFDPADYKVNMTGNSVTFAAANHYLLVNLRESVFLALILICMIMVGLFMSVRMITVSVLPSIIPLLITAGLMGFFVIALKPSTILIFSIAFGIASDGTIYFLTKYRHELRLQNFSISKAVSKTIHETGVSMVYTAVILFAGFGIFAASSFGGTQALGILISLTLLIAYCSNLVLLPAILLSLEKRLTTKAFLSEPLLEVYDEEEDIDVEGLEIQKTSKQESIE